MYTQRLKIPYDVYYRNPTRAVKELLGQHVSISSITDNDFILSDGCVAVDVEYSNIYNNLNPDEIYYVESSAIKQLYPDSDQYIAVIDDNPVTIKLPKKPTTKYVPMNVKLTLPSQDPNDSKLQFSYYGMIVTQPLQQIASPLKYINHQYDIFYYTAPKIRYDDAFKKNMDKLLQQQSTSPQDSSFPPLQTLSQTIAEYKKALASFKILKYVTNVVFAKTFKDASDPSTAYVINYSQIPRKVNLNGIILILSKRTPYYILYHPTLSFQILEKEFDSLVEFIENDYINFLNYHYLMKE